MRMTSGIPIIQQSMQHAKKVAIVDENGRYTYQQLLNDALQVASKLLGLEDSLDEQPITFLVPPTYTYLKAQWGIWLSGAMAVPLAVNHPMAELEYVLEDTGSSFLLYHPVFEEKAKKLAQKYKLHLLCLDTLEAEEVSEVTFPDVLPSQNAMMIYTSGTTGKPKGVVTTHENITAHIKALTQAWHWTKDDCIVNILPLHHVHGIVNVVACSLWNGATCHLFSKFDLEKLWVLFFEKQLTLFMAVPTIYAKMIASYTEMNAKEKEQVRESCRAMRLMVSGSAALPVRVLLDWERISGHVLLERYGMTEIGMALSNAYTQERVPGHVGKPLPFVEVMIATADGTEVTKGEPGELLVKGPSVFKEYWQKPKATKEAFTEEGWFKTGDIVQQNEEGIFKILGRQSVDIIKTGGYKVSALEIEEVLREHDQIVACAVVGLPSEEWGQEIAVALVLQDIEYDIEVLKNWVKEQLAPYKKPTHWKVVSDLPKNAMGKVVKPRITELFLT
jgi:malonyl-CoA/methylmalonyl-CoA synthetase